MLTRPTVIINNAPITLPPVGPTSSVALNPLYTACDAANGNYFMTTGRDLVSFYCAPALTAPLWLSTTTYLTGQVVNFSGTAYIALQGNLNQIPTSLAPYWAVYTDGNSTVTLYSAPDACTSRTVSTTNPPLNPYVVPVATELYPEVEFLVLPSSTYTQANQQFQFTASSNLVSVYVRNF
jgi:hypothetical protein